MAHARAVGSVLLRSAAKSRQAFAEKVAGFLRQAYLVRVSGDVPAAANARCSCLRTVSTAVSTCCITGNVSNTIVRWASGTWARSVLR